MSIEPVSRPSSYVAVPATSGAPRRLVGMPEKTFYLEQAAVCADAANGATLENERSKFRAAEKAWRALADTAEKRAARWLRHGLGS